MKIIELECPNCGATIRPSEGAKTVTCKFCGSDFAVDDGVTHLQYDNAMQAGYEFEKGRQLAREELAYNSYSPQPVRKRRIWPWVLGWLFCPYIPATILVARSKKLSRLAKVLIIAAIWIALFIIGAVYDVYSEKMLPDVPENPALVTLGEYVNKSDTEDGYATVKIGKREYIPFGTLESGTLLYEVAEKCVAVKEDDENTRYYSLKESGDFIVDHNAKGFMEIDMVYRAVDTIDKDIDIPEYIESNDYDIWLTS